MLYGNKQLYNQTRSLRKGTRRLSPCMEALRTRISERLGIKVVNVVYDAIDIGPAKGRPRLNVIVESVDDYKRLHKDPFTIKTDAKETILNEFSDIVRQMELTSEFDTNNVLLVSDTFSDAAMNQAIQQFFHDDREALIEKFSSDRIWGIFCEFKVTVVFFIDEETKNSGLAGGAGDRIRQACYDIVKRYDEFNYITPENFTVLFDSKENLDKNYEGNLYYYFK